MRTEMKHSKDAFSRVLRDMLQKRKKEKERKDKKSKNDDTPPAQRNSLPCAAKKGNASQMLSLSDEDDNMPLKELAKKLKAQERGKGKRRDSPNNQFLHAKKELHCEKCGYTSTSPYHMKEHKDKCVEGKTFACSQCNKKFAHRMQVYRHEKSEH